MCHLILLMPVLGIPIFWLIPLNLTIPSYIVIVLLSTFLYWLIIRAIKKPIQDGFQSLIGTEDEVIFKRSPDGSTRYLVRSQGELWNAYSTDVLEIGEPVDIVAVKGIGIVAERVR